MDKKYEKYWKKYLIECQVWNMTPNKRDFLGYLSDQKMLERFRKKGLDK